MIKKLLLLITTGVVLCAAPVFATTYTDTTEQTVSDNLIYTDDEVDELIHNIQADKTNAFLAATLINSGRIDANGINKLYQAGILTEMPKTTVSMGQLAGWSEIEALSNNGIVHYGHIFTELNDNAERAFANMTADALEDDSEVYINTLASSNDTTMQGMYMSFTELNKIPGYINFMDDNMEAVLYAWKISNWKSPNNYLLNMKIEHDDKHIHFEQQDTLPTPVTIWLKMDIPNMNYNITYPNGRVKMFKADKNGYIQLEITDCYDYLVAHGTQTAKIYKTVSDGQLGKIHSIWLLSLLQSITIYKEKIMGVIFAIAAAVFLGLSIYHIIKR